mmetsp:Transcript_18696/g.33496  ORF Transcript_18696/g.33496 Transcript_18696/m.33496 type:complete len:229 (-) Transcript_18696:1728-2414(-)
MWPGSPVMYSSASRAAFSCSLTLFFRSAAIMASSKASSCCCVLRSSASCCLRFLRSSSSLFSFSLRFFRLRSSRASSLASCSALSFAASSNRFSLSCCRHSSSCRNCCASASLRLCSNASLTFRWSASKSSRLRLSSRRRSCSLASRSAFNLASRSCSSMSWSIDFFSFICHHSGVADLDREVFLVFLACSRAAEFRGRSGQRDDAKCLKDTLFQTLAFSSKMQKTNC